MAGSTPASVTIDGGLWADARRRLRGNRAAVASAALVVLLVVAALLGPVLSPYAIDHVDWTLSPLASPPSLENGHWFGTDSNGRDLFVRVWAGTQVSLLVALLATAVSVIIGVAWGATAGYLGGRIAQHFPGKPRLGPPKRERFFDYFVIFETGEFEIGIESVFVVYQKTVLFVLKAEVFEKILDIYPRPVNSGVVKISGVDSDFHFDRILAGDSTKASLYPRQPT